MRLIIAEKPSLGRAIAAVLPGPQRRENGLVRCGGDTVVSWCIGHLLEPAEPGHYDPQWQRWRLEKLPMFPARWQHQPRPKVEAQLKLLQHLISEASLVVHAGDPDREGQWLVDEVLQWSDCRVPVKRILINDLNPDAVRRALDLERDNAAFQTLSASAETRQRADWLFGLNLTRACTLLKRARNEQGVYSIGRVQTPVLGLVVERDNRIADFVPVPYFRILAQVQSGQESAASPFIATWQADEQYAAHLDDENRLLDETVAREIAETVSGSTGTITSARFKERSEPPPLPLSLSALQIEAARIHDMPAQEVLDIAQALYENHRLITYPRSDSRYLPEGHWAEGPGLIATIASNLPDLGQAAAGADPGRRSRAWDDAKVEAHHAIIPTRRQADIARLDQRQQKIYGLVCRFYLMQFMADAVHRDGRLECTLAGHRFLARETGVVSAGWQALELRRSDSRDKPAAAPLPRLAKGDPVRAAACEVKARRTQPPVPFTDATLLAAMTGIARFVSDPELRKTLRDTDGLGTEATRAGILETLFKREYLTREARYIRSTPRARQLIAELPSAISSPDRTAHWEATLENVRHGSVQPEVFIAGLQSEIRELIRSMIGTQHVEISANAGVDADRSQGASPQSPQCPACRSAMRMKDGPYGQFWSCQRYPDCRATRRLDDTLAETDGTRQPPVPCPFCFAPLKRRQGPKGWFWGCSQYPACRHTVPDDEGKPRLPPRTR
ncbi:DNA topoisomerase III [Hydrocarboniclastica marina]|uniref:DNA topoisomerase n=1 Tax=Hydrocarboniclastica marina TaxID=2259620 RepID=A0A4P7XGD9_9ALTE|nr:DNA topoisomerase III [Hydrocarboniclastica marina]QCF25504.1 DNA topoisomerase III [Hydrocarboniclastica marina]